LRWLWEEHGAPKLDQHIRHYPAIRPRCQTIDRATIDKVMSVVPPHVRLWLLLCSDLAIRSTTAATIAPEHYHPETQTLRFTTKKQAKLTLPVTAEIAALIAQCDQSNPEPFVRQLWPATTGPAKLRTTTPLNATMSLRAALRRCLRAHGITQRIIPHDLRRTTAVAMLEHTHDVRDVQAILGHRSLQATIWYLDHDLRPIKRSTLEIIKRPHPPEEETICA
jgi:integrase